MKRTRRVKTTVFVILFLWLAVLTSLPALGASENCSISVTLKELPSPSEREGLTGSLYRVGSVAEDGRPMLDARYQIRSYPTDGAGFQEAAKRIRRNLKDEAPVAEKAADSNGRLSFPNLERGIYLLTFPEENAYGRISPTLIHLPYHEVVNGSLNGPVYQAEIEPKAEPMSAATPVPTQTKTPGPTPTEKAEPKVTSPGGSSGGYTKGGSGSSTHGTEISKKGAKTGDDSPVRTYVALSAAALAVILSLIIWRRRNGK